MITCPKCTKENQDHYKFCLGCGAELPRDASPKKFSPGTPPQGVQAARVPQFADESTAVGTGTADAERPVPQPAPAGPPGAGVAMGGMGAAPVMPAPARSVASSSPPDASAGPAVCPQCGHENAGGNRFCASCGFKLGRPQSAPAPAAAAPVAQPAGSASNVVLTALRADGTEAGTYALPGGTVTIGRDTGNIFAGDSYMSPRHATFTPKGGKLFIVDESSLNGVYKKLRREQPVAIRPGDVFRIGQEILRFEALKPLPPNADGVERLGSPARGYVGRIALVTGRDTTGNAYPVPETGLHLGRERGDVLFPEDGYVSGLHCRISQQNGQLHLTDLGSSNGTFVRLTAEAELVSGDILLMGQQLFRIALGAA